MLALVLAAFAGLAGREWAQEAKPNLPIRAKPPAGGVPDENERIVPNIRVDTNQVLIPVTAGKLDLGPWERVHYGEFDGQRPKRIVLKAFGIGS